MWRLFTTAIIINDIWYSSYSSNKNDFFTASMSLHTLHLMNYAHGSCLGWFYPYTSGLFHWHWGNHMIAPVPVKQPWSIWVNTSHKSTKNNTKTKQSKTMCIFHGIYSMLHTICRTLLFTTTTKQSTTKPCTYFMEYTFNSPPDWDHLSGT